jgi:predicted ATP-dependent serine protease
MKIEDPAADLAVALAITSAFRGKNISGDTVVLGEVGLAGEIRSIAQVALRINEAEKLGFNRCILPANNYKNLPRPSLEDNIALKEGRGKKGAIELVPAAALKEAFDIALEEIKR